MKHPGIYCPEPGAALRYLFLDFSFWRWFRKVAGNPPRSCVIAPLPPPNSGAIFSFLLHEMECLISASLTHPVMCLRAFVRRVVFFSRTRFEIFRLEEKPTTQTMSNVFDAHSSPPCCGKAAQIMMLSHLLRFYSRCLLWTVQLAHSRSRRPIKQQLPLWRLAMDAVWWLADTDVSQFCRGHNLAPVMSLRGAREAILTGRPLLGGRLFARCRMAMSLKWHWNRLHMHISVQTHFS